MLPFEELSTLILLKKFQRIRSIEDPLHRKLAFKRLRKSIENEFLVPILGDLFETFCREHPEVSKIYLILLLESIFDIDTTNGKVVVH